MDAQRYGPPRLFALVCFSLASALSFYQHLLYLPYKHDHTPYHYITLSAW